MYFRCNETCLHNYCILVSHCWYVAIASYTARYVANLLSKSVLSHTISIGIIYIISMHTYKVCLQLGDLDNSFIHPDYVD